VKKVYIAGPQVFRPDAEEYYLQVQQRCQALGLYALIPWTPDPDEPAVIFQRNVRLLTECDGVVAGVDPFRGGEPDSGTAWEIGFAYALGKPIVMWGMDYRPVAEKHAPYITAGWAVENFGFAHNLMLVGSAKFYYRGGVLGAIEKIAEVLPR